MFKLLLRLTKGRRAVFVTMLLVTLLIYVVRGIGLLNMIPGWMLLLLLCLTYGLFLLAIQPQRKIW